MSVFLPIPGSYDTKSTVTKFAKPAISRIVPSKLNQLCQYAIIYEYDPVDRDYIVIKETCDLNEIRSYHRAMRAGYCYQIEFKYPGSYYGTWSELRWCDTCATKEPIFTCKYEDNGDLPF